jgi:hypothetical protein
MATIDLRMLECITKKPLIMFYKQAWGKLHKIQRTLLWLVCLVLWFRLLRSHVSLIKQLQNLILEWNGRVLPLFVPELFGCCTVAIRKNV